MTSRVSLRGGKPPLVAHVIERLAVGGLENGLVNLINHMPRERYHHAIICLTDSTEFKTRIQSNDVAVIELNKAPGQDLGVHARLWKVLRQLRPDIVHTRNLPALECQLTAALAGVRGRVHGEHGRDMYDLDGTNFKYNALRKVMHLFIHRYIAVSRNLADWLVNTVKVPRQRVTQIYNGVESEKFRPRKGPREAVGPGGFCSSESFVVGTVGRMEPVKDQLTFVRAFIHLLREEPDLRKHMRLILVGDGSLREQGLDLLREAQAEQLAWLPGERSDIPEIMRAMDLFVLPSIREGISNTILEAMASGLPVIATDVGGNPELLAPGKTGMFVPPSDPIAMARAIRSYFEDVETRSEHGAAGRIRIENEFSMTAMVDGYLKTYDVIMREQSLKMITPTSASVVSPSHLNISWLGEMNPFRRVLTWAVVRLGGLRVIRVIANVFELKTGKNGHLGFPFIKRRRRHGVQILVYHRVNDERDLIFPGIPTKAFAEQMEYVAEHYTVCSLSETVQRIQSEDLPAALLTITFDDGYRDNYENAFPILTRLGLPATIFLATDAIDSGRTLWHDRVFHALRESRASALEKFGDTGQTYPLNTPAERRRALAEVLKFLWSLEDRDKCLWIERLFQELRVEDSVRREGLMLSWDDIRAMSERRISFGAHTVTHPILSKIPPRQVRQEILESKEIIEVNLKTPVKHFAYPVGRREDFTDAVKKQLRDAAFDCAVTTIFGSNDSQQDLFELRRATPWDQDVDSFALRLNYFKFVSC